MMTGTRAGAAAALALPLLLAVAYILPLGGVVGWSVSRPSGVGLGHYREIFSNPAILSIMWTTARISIVTTVVSVVLAYFIAYHLRFGSSRKKQILLAAVLVPFWLSVLIRAFAWLVILRGGGPVDTLIQATGLFSEPPRLVRNEFGVVVGMVHFMVPYAVFPLLSAMNQVDDRVLQAARSLGASFWESFRDVFLPLTGFGIVAAAMIVFVFSLGFFVTPSILGGGRVVMVSEYIYVQMFQVSDWGLGSAVSVVLMAAVVLVTLLLVRLVGIRRLAESAA